MGFFFEKFSAGDDPSFSILQYADDTIIMCKNTRENLWCLKSVLRIFEMASGLRVNFHKSCLVGMNVDFDELNNAARVLYCQTRSNF